MTVAGRKSKNEEKCQLGTKQKNAIFFLSKIQNFSLLATELDLFNSKKNFKI